MVDSLLGKGKGNRQAAWSEMSQDQDSNQSPVIARVGAAEGSQGQQEQSGPGGLAEQLLGKKNKNSWPLVKMVEHKIFTCSPKCQWQ